MTVSHRLTISLVGSLLLAGWGQPGWATELAVRPIKVATAAPVKKPIRTHFVRIAASEGRLSLGCWFGGGFPLVIGVAY
jgi:hypothetical protein